MQGGLRLQLSLRLRRQRGFSLVELTVVCAMAGLLAAIAWPRLHHMQLQGHRADAVEALTKLQLAQARFHALHGLYAHDLKSLKLAPQGTSAQGLYALALEAADGENWRASATALPGSRQAADVGCTRLTLEVRQGFASVGPSARCWNR